MKYKKHVYSIVKLNARALLFFPFKFEQVCTMLDDFIFA